MRSEAELAPQKRRDRPRGAWRRGAALATLLLAALSGAAWGELSAPRLHTVFRTAGTTKAPHLIADPAGRLHLFFLAGERRDAGRLTDRLMYAVRQNGSWSEPLVVHMGKRGQRLDLATIALDSAGWFHAVWQMPPFGHLYYSRVYAARAGERDAWTRRTALVKDAAFRSQLRADDRGRLHFVYARSGRDVYYKQSTDGGRSWSDPVAVSRVVAGREATDYPRLAVDGRGVIHVVWTQYEMPRGVPPTGVFYSRSSDGGQTWTAPHRFAGERRAQINVQTRGEKEVHVVWHGVVAVGDRKHSWSADGGDTWSDPTDLPGHIRGGLTGPSPLVLDGAGVLHVVSAVQDTPKIERVVTSTWRDGAWSTPELLSGGCGAVDSVEQPSAAVLLGDELHTAFEVDYRAIVDSVIALPAGHVAPRPLPTMRAPTLGDRLRDASPQLYVLAATVAMVAVTAALQLVRCLWGAARRSGWLR